MKITMRQLCRVALCAMSLIIGNTDGFQQQQLQSQRNPLRSNPASIGNLKPRSPAPQPSTPDSATTTQLNALPALSTSPLGAVTVLAGIVVVHEAGHYLAARSFNITVEEFSVGFGPKLAGFEAYGNEFNLRALPLGGYVRFPENYDGEAIREIEELKMKARRTLRRARTEWNWKDETLNALTLGYWDERSIDKNIQQRKLEKEASEAKAESKSFLARLFGGKNSKTKKKVVAEGELDTDELYDTLGDLEDFEVEYYDDPQLLQNRPWFERAVVLSGGVIFNLILAFSIYFAAIGPLPVGTSQGLPRAVFDNGVVVSQDPRADGPSKGLLRKGDIITSINGQPVEIQGSTKTSVAAGQKQVSDVISVIRKTPDGESVSVNVLRAEGGAISAGKDADKAAKLSSQTINIKPSRSDGSIQTIGVMLGPRFDRLEQLKSDNPIVAMRLAWEYLSDIFSQTLFGTLSVLTSFLSSNGPPPGQKISGPIGLISQGSTVVATKDLTTILMFAAGLSVNLGVINALPLPALDGGQLVFVIAEAITGKKVDQKLQEGITSIAVLFLLWVSLSAAIGDVGSLFGR